MALAVDQRAIGLGSVIAIGLGAPFLLVYQALLNLDVIDTESPLVLLFYGALLVAFAIGGFVAGSKRPDTPLTHGAVAALVAFSTLRLIALVVQLVRGSDISVVEIVFNAMVASGAGLLGGYLAMRRQVPV